MTHKISTLPSPSLGPKWTYVNFPALSEALRRLHERYLHSFLETKSILRIQPSFYKA